MNVRNNYFMIGRRKKGKRIMDRSHASAFLPDFNVRFYHNVITRYKIDETTKLSNCIGL